APAATTDIASLEAQVTAQRIELDSLVDAYFSIPASTAAAPAAAQRNDLSMVNLAIVALAALLIQIMLAMRRRRARRDADMANWRRDQEAPAVTSSEQGIEPQREAA